MNPVLPDYLELIALTRQYLLQEHQFSDKLFAGTAEYSYFRNHALQQSQKQIPIQKTEVISKSTVQTHQPSVRLAPATPPPPPPSYTAPTSVVPSPAAPLPKRLPLPTFETPKETTKSAEAKKAPAEAVFFTLSPPSQQEPTDNKVMRKLISTTLPTMQLLDSIPDDSEARRLSAEWKQPKSSPEVLILAFDETPSHLEFLTKMGNAISIHGYTINVVQAKKIEAEGTWEMLLTTNVRLVLATHAGIHTLPGLTTFYMESAKGAKFTLNKIPLIPLSDISFYMQEASLKIPLWKAIKEQLSINTTR